MQKYLASIFLLSSLALSTVHAQASNGGWGGGTWSNAAGHASAGSPGSPGSGPMSTTDQQYSYGYAGIDSRGPYGGAGGNGGYYVGGSDDRGNVFSYGNGQPGQPGQPGYGNNRGYQDGYRGYNSGASGMLATSSLGLLLGLLALIKF